MVAKVFSILCVSLGLVAGAYGQEENDPVADAAVIVSNRFWSILGLLDEAEDYTELVLLANNLLTNITYMDQKATMVNQRYNELDKIMHEPHAAKYLSGPGLEGFVLRVQRVSMNVTLYGSAVQHLLSVVKRNLEAKAAAYRQRTQVDTGARDEENALMDVVFDIAEDVLHSAAEDEGAGFLGTGADMSRIDRQIVEAKTKADAITKLKSTTKAIQDANEWVLDVNKDLDKVYREVNLCYQGLTALVVGNGVMVINTATAAVPAPKQN